MSAPGVRAIEARLRLERPRPTARRRRAPAADTSEYPDRPTPADYRCIPLPPKLRSEPPDPGRNVVPSLGADVGRYPFQCRVPPAARVRALATDVPQIPTFRRETPSRRPDGCQAVVAQSESVRGNRSGSPPPHEPSFRFRSTAGLLQG